MPEILTESFCERCGTRYTFQAAAPKRSRTAKMKVLSRGLRNYVLSDETTLAEALADARSDEERAISSHQLEAFHQTFNFCMSCRQYTCGNCWNEVEARCLTCAPNLSHEVLPAPFPHLAHVGDGNAGPLLAEPPVTVWPQIDLVPTAEIPAAEMPAPAIEPSPTAAPANERAAALASRTRDLLARFRPGQRIDEAIEAFERAEQEAAAEVTSVAKAVVEEVAAEAIPAAPVEPVVAVEPMVAVEPAAAPKSEPAPVPAADRGGWRVVAPEISAPEGNGPLGEPALPAAASARLTAPQWPASPQWPAAAPSTNGGLQCPAPVAAGHAPQHTGTDALWVSSSRDVIGRPGSGVQACVSCGLPLSATARFCRRCGSRQG